MIFCLLLVVMLFSYKDESIDQWCVQLKAYVRLAGGHFEHVML